MAGNLVRDAVFGDEGPPTMLREGAVFDVLVSERRRAVIEVLDREGVAAVGLPELACRVAAIEAGGDPGDVDPQTRARVCRSLLRQHLPPLTGLGVLQRTPAGDTVECGPEFDLVADVRALAAARTEWDEWTEEGQR